eukprot:m.27709 g.27709  ORF g.27709 m.27709 type:complete len:77 (+) comp7923_c0_seq1:2582-2812(+)
MNQYLLSTLTYPLTARFMSGVSSNGFAWWQHGVGPSLVSDSRDSSILNWRILDSTKKYYCVPCTYIFSSLKLKYPF